MGFEIVKTFSKGENTYYLSKDGNSYDLSKRDKWGVEHNISKKLYTDDYIYRNSPYKNTSSIVPRLNKVNNSSNNLDLFIKDGNLVIESKINKGKMVGKKPIIVGETIRNSRDKIGNLAKKYLSKAKNYLKEFAKNQITPDNLKLSKFV